MYEHQGLQDIFFIMLYGGAAMLAMVACCYLLMTRGNMFLSTIKPPRELRKWAAAFMASVVASHVWWVVLGIQWLEDDKLLRNIIAITLDRLTFVPLMMIVLIRMLQDRKRPLWPVAVAMIPIAAIAGISIVTRNNEFELYTEYYSVLLGVAFTIYMVYSVRKYGRWLHENYADLEHKEVWQSLLLLACILLTYIAYTTNGGDLVTEYLAQVNTIVIIGFVLWRVETLQQLDDVTVDDTIIKDESEKHKLKEAAQSSSSYNIGEMLEQYCVSTKLYLQHDLTLQQLAVSIGTNRTYLSSYFAEQGLTYNAYINRLRVEHFMQLYREDIASSRSTTAQALAKQSGFHSYITFSVVFKKLTGTSVTEWMKVSAPISARHAP